MNADGVAYLDLSDAIGRGEWAGIVNGLWSPLYPAVLGIVSAVIRPSPYWECAVAHGIQFALYLLCFVSFEYFLKGFTSPLPQSKNGADLGIVEIMAYAAFCWTSIVLIRLRPITPDFLVASSIYGSAGLILRLCSSKHLVYSFALGAVLGLGYLSKAVMFPLGLLILALTSAWAFFSFHKPRIVVPAAATFLALISLELVPLSLRAGTFTFGDAAALNYAWHVNKVSETFWLGDRSGHGMPLHAPRLLSARPRMYEFSQPVGGTYPLGYDPAYWYTGLRPSFVLSEQVTATSLNLASYAPILFSDFSGPTPYLIALTIIVLASARKTIREPFLRWEGGWILICLAGTGLVLYSLVHVEGRYIAPFVGVLAVTLLEASRGSRTVVLPLRTIALIVFLPFAVGALQLSYHQWVKGSFFERDPYLASESWLVRSWLTGLGLKPNDSVAYVGDGYQAVWARVCRARIVAEAPPGSTSGFWQASDTERAEVGSKLLQNGVRMIIAEGERAELSGFERSLSPDGKLTAYVIVSNGPSSASTQSP